MTRDFDVKNTCALNKMKSISGGYGKGWAGGARAPSHFHQNRQRLCVLLFCYILVPINKIHNSNVPYLFRMLGKYSIFLLHMIVCECVRERFSVGGASACNRVVGAINSTIHFPKASSSTHIHTQRRFYPEISNCFIILFFLRVRWQHKHKSNRDYQSRQMFTMAVYNQPCSTASSIECIAFAISTLSICNLCGLLSVLPTIRC